MKRIAKKIMVIMAFIMGFIFVQPLQFISADTDHKHSYVALGVADGIVTKECTGCGKIIELNVPTKIGVHMGTTPGAYYSNFSTTTLVGSKLYCSVTVWTPSNASGDMEFFVDDPSIISVEQTSDRQATFTMNKPGVTNITVRSKLNLDVSATYKFTVLRVELNGFQISSTAEGFRTIYTVGGGDVDVMRAGLVYGLAEYVTENYMYIGQYNTNEYVYSYEATEKGKVSTPLYESDGSTTYAMTMTFDDCSPKFFESEILVRAFVQLSNGNYVYSDIKKSSVYNIADKLYQNNWMNNFNSHNYLFTEILSKVNPNYNMVDFAAGSGLVSP